ncbi:MAG: ATP-grasp domain-containing protein [Clostridia bacterium]|nr:ATP-grasp domain-containing protein [Clostridia bacterium]
MKVMVLGGGGCQMNMIRRLKLQGHGIVLVDYLSGCPGSALADEHYRISTFDSVAVSELLESTKPEAIITMGTDQPVLTAAVCAGRAGLPFYLTPGQALLATNKRIMKKIFKDNGIPTAEYRLAGIDFNDDEIAGLRFPAVLKPVDSQGQRGIFKVADADEARKHIRETLSYSREDKALLEEYYENDEITVNGWVDEGRAHILSVVDRVTMEAGDRIGICMAHNCPSLHLAGNRDEILFLTQKITEAFGFGEGPLYYQFLIGAQGIKVNEIAMRIGGAYEDITIPLISGVDILGMLIESVLKGRCGKEALRAHDGNLSNSFVTTQMFFIRPGKIQSLTPLSGITGETYVMDARYLISEGMESGEVENATARAGYFIVRGNDFNDMLEKSDAIYEKIKILDSKGRNLLIKYKDYSNKYKFL